jgi:hypothetical protein
MLGKTKTVKGMIEDFPDLLHSVGPHGFTLLHHAAVAEKRGKDLYDFFVDSGLTEKKINLY